MLQGCSYSCSYSCCGHGPTRRKERGSYSTECGSYFLERLIQFLKESRQSGGRQKRVARVVGGGLFPARKVKTERNAHRNEAREVLCVCCQWGKNAGRIVSPAKQFFEPRLSSRRSMRRCARDTNAASSQQSSRVSTFTGDHKPPGCRPASTPQHLMPLPSPLRNPRHAITRPRTLREASPRACPTRLSSGRYVIWPTSARSPFQTSLNAASASAWSQA